MLEKIINHQILYPLAFVYFLFQFVGCASVLKLSDIKESDHFDGEKFYNPTITEQFSPGIFDLFRLLFSDRAEWPEYVENMGIPLLNEKLEPDDINVTFVNHATFLIQFNNMNILTDPVWSERVSPVSCVGPQRVVDPGIKFEDLPKIDVIVISHNHYDHLDIKTIEKLNERFSPMVLIPVGDKELIESIGITNVQELDWWDSVQLNPNASITFTPTQHSSGRGLFDRGESLWGSYFILNGGRSVYFGGDAAYSTHYEEIKKRLGSPDIALLPIGAYLPRWFMKPIHMDPAEAVVAHKDLGAKLSIGIHIGCFQQSSEAYYQPHKDLKEALEKEKISLNNFIILHEGSTKICSVEQPDLTITTSKEEKRR